MAAGARIGVLAYPRMRLDETRAQRLGLWHALRMFEPWQLELIEESRVARLATLARDGTPQLVPVCYAFVPPWLVIAVDEKPKRPGKLARVANVERDGRAWLLIDRYDDDWTRLAWLRIDCAASVAAQARAFPPDLAALRSRYSQYESMDLESRPLIRLQPVRVRGWRWSE